MKKINDIPVVVVHKKAGKTYRLNGVLKGINQINETCTVKFSNCKVIENVPMNKIMIDEGFLDKIKELGNKVKNWFVQKVGDFFQVVDQNGRELIKPASLFINKVIMYQKGNLPDAVTFAVGDATKKELESAGVKTGDLSIDAAFAPLIAEECRELNAFWADVIERYGSTSETLGESYKYVERKMYGSPKKLNENLSLSDIKKKLLLESDKIQKRTIDTLSNPDEIMTGKQGVYGASYNTKELMIKIRQNIIIQMQQAQAIAESSMENETVDNTSYILNTIQKNKGDEEDTLLDLYDDEMLDYTQDTTVGDVASGLSDPGRPLIIFGAAGIGKTQIVKKVLKQMKGTEYGNLNIVAVNCSGLLGSDLTMPARSTVLYSDDDELQTELTRYKFSKETSNRLSSEGGEFGRVETMTEWWLPVYVPGDDKTNKAYEKFYATSAHLNKKTIDSQSVGLGLNDKDGDAYTGGVIFLDELSRIHPSAENAFTAILQRNIQGHVFAKSWYMIAAANRLTDDITGNENFLNNNTIMSRLNAVHFRPTFDEFLDYIKSYNEDTDNGAVTFNPQFISFIESAGESVWFQSIETGSFDEDLAEWVAKNVNKEVIENPENGEIMKQSTVSVDGKPFDLADPMSINDLRKYKNNSKDGYVGLKWLLAFVHANEKANEGDDEGVGGMVNGDSIIPTLTIKTDINSRTLADVNIGYNSVITQMLCDIMYNKDANKRVVTDDNLLQQIYGGVFDDLSINDVTKEDLKNNILRYKSLISKIRNKDHRFSDEESNRAKEEFSEIKRNGGGLTDERLTKCIYCVLQGWYGKQYIDRIFKALENNSELYNKERHQNKDIEGKHTYDGDTVKFHCMNGWKTADEMGYEDVMYFLRWIMRDIIKEKTKGASEATRQNELYNEWWGELTTTTCYNDILERGEFSEDTLKTINYKVLAVLRNPENVERYMSAIKTKMSSLSDFKAGMDEYKKYLEVYSAAASDDVVISSLLGNNSTKLSAAKQKVLKSMFNYNNIVNVKKNEEAGIQITEQKTMSFFDKFFRFMHSENKGQIVKETPEECYDKLYKMCCENSYIKYIINYCKFYVWLMKLIRGGSALNSTFNNLTTFFNDVKDVRSNLLDGLIDAEIIRNENKCDVKFASKQTELLSGNNADDAVCAEMCALGRINISKMCFHLGNLMKTDSMLPASKQTRNR